MKPQILLFGAPWGRPRGKFLSLRSRIVGGFASLRFAPHIRLSSDLKFFPGDPPIKFGLGDFLSHKIGDNSVAPGKKNEQVSYRLILL